MTGPKALIAHLALAPHPEGGSFRETVRIPSPDGGRDQMTAILFLLEQGQRFHWHRVDAAELWLWHAGAPLTLHIDDGTATTTHHLGPDLTGPHVAQALVPPHAWQSAEAPEGWSLVSCVVSPGFDFSGFTLAPPGWSPR